MKLFRMVIISYFVVIVASAFGFIPFEMNGEIYMNIGNILIVILCLMSVSSEK